MTNWIAAAGNHVSYDEIDWTLPSSLIIGSEASGASITALKMFNGRVSIPMEREMDSLNVAVAAGVILFEGLRQRRYTGSE
jgi:TrmH family RNA methyltransferase